MQTMEKLEVNGVDLPYAEAGSGEAVLLIGTGPIADSFVPLLSEKALVDRYRLITYRQRRRDRSDGNGTPVSFASHAADAAALLDRLGIRRAHVAGHSTGAAIALQLASDRPDLVQSLILLEPPLFSVPSAASFFEKAGPALAAYGAGDRGGAMAAFLSMVCSLDWETCRAVIDRHIPGASAEALQNADNFFESYLPALNEWQFDAARAAAIRQPVLSVVGTQTEPLFAEGHKLLQAWFPQVEDCTVPGVGHLLHVQEPQPIARGVAGFLALHPMEPATAADRGDAAGPRKAAGGLKPAAPQNPDRGETRRSGSL